MNLQDLPSEWLLSIKITGTIGERNVTFVNKRGAIKMIMKTRATAGSKIDNFQNWAVTKLDELLTTGKAEIKDKKMVQLQTQLTLAQKQIQHKDQQIQHKKSTNPTQRSTIE